MRVLTIFRMAMIFWPVATATGPAAAQLSDMEATRYYFLQMGRLAGTLAACWALECRRRYPDKVAHCPGLLVQDPIANLEREASRELKSCGATDSQIRELGAVFRAESSTYYQFPCPLSSFSEAEDKHVAALKAIRERNRAGTTCSR